MNIDKTPVELVENLDWSEFEGSLLYSSREPPLIIRTLENPPIPMFILLDFEPPKTSKLIGISILYPKYIFLSQEYKEIPWILNSEEKRFLQKIFKKINRHWNYTPQKGLNFWKCLIWLYNHECIDNSDKLSLDLPIPNYLDLPE